MKKTVAKILTILLMLLLHHPVAQAQRKNLINRTLDKAYKIVQGDSSHPHKRYLFPVPIIAYKPETRWIFGISLTHLFRSQHFDTLTRPSAIRLNTSYSQNDQFSLRTMVDLFTQKNRFNIKGLAQYTNFAEYFWGFGIGTPDAAKELYDFKMNKINVKAAYLVLPKLYAGIQFNFEQMYDVSYQFPAGNMASLANSTHGYLASGAGFTVYYDDRDNIFFPKKGHIIELSNCVYHKNLGSEYGFSNITFDGRKYIGLWKENVLAIQAVVNINSGDIPFRLLGTLGSDSYMRGYYNGRYRDRCAMAFQTELRKTIWGPVSIVAFGGFGTVNSDISGLTTHIKPNYGGGLRVMAIPREKMNIRMDYGRGVDGNAAFYLTMGEAF